MHDLNEILTQLAALPGAAQLLGQAENALDQEATAARAACLSKIAAAEAELAKQTAAVAKARTEFEAVQEKFHEARGRIGSAEQRRGTVENQLHALRRELRVEHGEAAAIHAETRFENLIQHMRLQIQNLESALQPRQSRAPLTASAKTMVEDQLHESRRILEVSEHGLSVVREELALRPIPPREIAARVAELLEQVDSGK